MTSETPPSTRDESSAPVSANPQGSASESLTADELIALAAAHTIRTVIEGLEHAFDDLFEDGE